MTIGSWTLADPAWLLLLLALPIIGWLRARRGRTVLVIPFVSRWAGGDVIPRSRVAEVMVAAGLVLLTIALARPQHIDEKRQVRQQGYDIVLAIDLSGHRHLKKIVMAVARLVITGSKDLAVSGLVPFLAHIAVRRGKLDPLGEQHLRHGDRLSNPADPEKRTRARKSRRRPS